MCQVCNCPNKRSLHTIGFRGIGFKSTFSLGDVVHLRTPTLSVVFRSKRFTEPVWDETSEDFVGGTTISVRLRDALIEQEIARTLQDWLVSPLSLLFFRNIQSLTIGETELLWKSVGRGPVAGSEWMTLNGCLEQPLLRARSSSEEFPKEALDELVQERMVPVHEAVAFPPSSVDIVLGAKGLYVVLNAGMDTNLPFACNAPFIQDPARIKIKDPEISPTNRWLLERAGRFAASVMLKWLGKSDISIKDRSRAYEIMPDVNRDDRSPQGICATTVELAFASEIDNQPVLLTDSGQTKVAGESIILPERLLDIWPEEQVSSLLDGSCRPVFSRHVSPRDRQKLMNWKMIEEITRPDVVKILSSSHLPKPDGWSRLLKLWNFIYPETTGYHPAGQLEAIRIVPVQGKEVLYAGNEVVRLGEKRLLASDADWDFLADSLLVLDPNWPRYLSDQRRLMETKSIQDGIADVGRASSVFASISLADASDVNGIIARVCVEFFADEERSLGDCIRLSQIAAKLNVNVGEALRFATKDLDLRSIDEDIIYDPRGTIESVVPEVWAAKHLTNETYAKSFQSCTAEEWLKWISSGRAGLLTCIPIRAVAKGLWGQAPVEDELRRRGVRSSPLYPYRSSEFRLHDWDFEESLWIHWKALAVQDERVWSSIAEQILAQSERFWSPAKSARILQSSGRGNTSSIVNEPILPKWVLTLRELPCLTDTRGFCRRPAELLRRTDATLPLLDIEAFIDHRFDNEATRPLLDLLGVGSTPAGPHRLLDRLRALAQSVEPPVATLEKLYRSLDRLVDTCSTEDLKHVKAAFHDEPIVFTDSGTWSSAPGVFIAAEVEGLPGGEFVRSSVRDLSMWHKLGVAERPTPELEIEWLSQLEMQSRLSVINAKRVRELLARYPTRIWDESHRWLNLAGEIVPLQSLKYSLSKQSGTPWNHLHEWVKQETADFQRLSGDISASLPFTGLPSLGSQIEERFEQTPLLTEVSRDCPWLRQLGQDLMRIVPIHDETDIEAIRTLASDLARTVLQIVPRLELTPYLRSVPAGTPRRSEACWTNGVLYVEDRPMPKLAKAVARELGRSFGRVEIEEAIKFCFDRPAEFVTEYMEENFKLVPRELDEPFCSRPDTTQVTIPDQDRDSEQPDADNFEVAAPQPFAREFQETTTALNPMEASGVGAQGPAPRTAPPPRSQKPNILERFAAGKGFRKDPLGRFYHPNGSWIAKQSGNRFWEWRALRGELVRYLYAREICLEREPLDIEAEDWKMIEAHPETHSMILADSKGNPIEVAGSAICQLKDSGVLKLYQTHFRLVCEDIPQSFNLLRPPDQA